MKQFLENRPCRGRFGAGFALRTIVAAALIALAACAPDVNVRGNAVKRENLAKIKPGTSDAAACTVDYFPTLMDIVGFEMPDNRELDGISLVPLIENPDAEWKDRLDPNVKQPDRSFCKHQLNHVSRYRT